MDRIYKKQGKLRNAKKIRTCQRRDPSEGLDVPEMIILKCGYGLGASVQVRRD
jgi:hypothetical protein